MDRSRTNRKTASSTLTLREENYLRFTAPIMEVGR